ncbi:magnesium transporter CorA [Flavihumibacter sp. R14]|nr:magnesium transporter CorA [Flavihumibacter soli]
MKKILCEKAENSFHWIDLTDPTKEELSEITEKYKLHAELVIDCLQPDHLPKFESLEDYNFFIFRIHSNDGGKEPDTVQELTHKIAVFYSKDFVITIHRKPQQFIEDLVKTSALKSCDSTLYFISALIRACLDTYNVEYAALTKDVDFYEHNIFLRERKFSLLKGLYLLKRKVDLLRRMLMLSYDIIDNVDTEDGNVDTRDTRDLYIKLQNIYDTLSDNINQLVNIYFSVSAQRTNDTMRILTIFSVFFMPLTFIVGIYGMNFDFMPELKSKWGYPVTLMVMAVVTMVIYQWFKRKKWL